jgi:hypothetical protein
VRRVMYMVAGMAAAAAVTVGAVGVASGANTVKCGGLYQPTCKSPTIVTTISTTCHKEGTTIHIPAITIKAIAGLREIEITVKGSKKPVKVYKNLHSATSKKVGGITVNTHGLKPGAHTIMIKVIDTRGKTVTKSYRIAICTIKPPPFTG